MVVEIRKIKKVRSLALDFEIERNETPDKILLETDAKRIRLDLI